MAHGLGVGLHGHLVSVRQRTEQARALAAAGEGRRATAEEDRLERVGEHRPFELELSQHGVDVGGVRAVPVHDRDEVAVAAAVGAERKVDIEMANVPGHPSAPLAVQVEHGEVGLLGDLDPADLLHPLLPFFCFSISFRLRVMSPP